MSRDGVARYRAGRGADASRMATTRFAPLRKITGGDTGDLGLEVEILECGHTLRPRSDMIGRTYTERRRCVDCLKASCAAGGHELVDWYGPDNILRSTYMACRCQAVKP